MDNWKKQVADFAKDLKVIKTAVEKNSSLLKKVLYTPMMKILSFAAGAIVIVFVLIYRHFIVQFSGYENIPQNIRVILLISIILSLLAAQAIKMFLLFRYKKNSPDISMLEYLQKLAGSDYFYLFPFAFLIGIFFIIFFSIIGKPDFIIPSVALMVSVLGVSMGAHLCLIELVVMGYWFGLTGILSIPFISAPNPDNLLWIAIVFGLGFILFGLMIIFRGSRKTR